MQNTKLAVLLLVLTGCTAPDRSTEALQSSGYTNITMGGYGWFECGSDDKFHTEFTATNPTGKRVEGVVCCGWVKGCTVRF